MGPLKGRSVPLIKATSRSRAGRGTENFPTMQISSLVHLGDAGACFTSACTLIDLVLTRVTMVMATGRATVPLVRCSKFATDAGMIRPRCHPDVTDLSRPSTD